ncbi:MAG: Crp/Fnr family transcriptional regulator [Gammaproteobacteria bacterium]|nr:Crp/Fnr family transcriptional regulator [Gammaproteobacteria bacterium]
MDIKSRNTSLMPQADPEILEIINAGKQQHMAKGTRLSSESDHRRSFIWLRKGTIRVFKTSAHGREVTLYRINQGEPCPLNVRRLLLDETYSAEAITETEVTILTLSHEQFHSAIDDSKAFRFYILNFLSQRIGDIIDLVSEASFEQLEFRLARLLAQSFKRSNGHPITATHEQLANELGTSREVVSRILKALECQKCIRLARGKIDLISIEGLNWPDK